MEKRSSEGVVGGAVEERRVRRWISCFGLRSHSLITTYEIDIVSVADDNKALRAEESPTYHG